MTEERKSGGRGHATGEDFPPSPPRSGYVHGYSREEQDRLYEQARFLEARVYESIDFAGASRIVEAGCGVGAQTEILLERFPHLTIDGIDFSADQVARARERLAGPLAKKQVTLTVGDASKMPFKDNTYDGAFVCFLLEHLAKPVDVLGELRRVLKPGGRVYCTEVLNATFFIHPYSPATLTYWFAFNDHQWNIGGDPFVGAKLGNYLMAAGYQNIATEVKSFHYDNRTPKMRGQMIEYWTRLLLSGVPALLGAKKIAPEVVTEMKQELGRLQTDPDAVFFYSCIQAKGQAF